MSAGDYSHAGAVVYRDTDLGPRYLLVAASDDAAARVFPKGHIEAGESPEATALRELKEEAGVIAHIDRLLGTLEFEAKDESVRSAMYLMKFEGFVDQQEARARDWLSYDDALAALDFDDTRDLLTAANAIVSGKPSPT